MHHVWVLLCGFFWSNESKMLFKIIFIIDGESLIYFLSSPQFLCYIYCVHSILSANILNTDCVSVKYEVFKPREKNISKTLRF